VRNHFLFSFTAVKKEKVKVDKEKGVRVRGKSAKEQN
jgi:hypothetical protein